MRNLTMILTGMVLLMALQGCSSTSGWYHLPAAEFDQIDYGYTMHKAKVRNIEVGYLDEGRGDVVLLIHGLGSNAKGWARNIPALAAGHRVSVCEIRYSTNPTNPGAPLISAVFSPDPKRLERL